MSRLAVVFEHPDWFLPLFAELARRGVEAELIDARAPFAYDPADSAAPPALLFNRMSPSGHLRGFASSILFTENFLAHYERLGSRVINGSRAFRYEVSKALQLTLLAQLGLTAPRSRVIHRASDAPIAAAGLRFPIIVKANIGGSGVGIERYETPAALAAAADDDVLPLGLDSIALVQEFVPARDGRITRVETLGGRFLSAIDVFPEAGGFDLCPVEAPRRGLRIERTSPEPEVVAACERIAQAAGLDVGGIESMIDDRDGTRVYFDINALSLFANEAPRIFGFDPHERLVDFLLAELAKSVSR